MATKNPRTPVTMDEELFQQVTAYRREYGISSQSKAIQRLVRLGLESERKRSVSQADSAAQERELLTTLRELDPAQKALLLRVLRLAGGSEETRRTP